MVALFTAGLPIFPIHSQAETASWNSPNIDVWTYPAPETPGVRTLGPTFLTSPGLDEYDQFLPSTSRDPARRGMSFAVFDTSTNIQTDLGVGQYQINAATVTFTMQESTAGFIAYDDTPDTNAELLDDYVNDNIDTARPMELYGVGLQADYTGFDFGSGEGGDIPYSETTYPYSPADGTGVLIAHPIAADEVGQYVDVSNSLTGGYSATAPGNTTAPFDPVPWSIGTAAGLSPGDIIPDSTTFSFALDLELPGVAEYVQQGLADGSLGFFLSSNHFSGDPHNGSTIPYPQWYLKEFNPLFGGIAPTLEIDYALLSLPGDYDENGSVDAADYTVWLNNLGNANSLPNDDTAGVGQDDYLRWKNQFGTTLASVSHSVEVNEHTVPEPASLCIMLLAAGISLALRPFRRPPLDRI